MSDVRLYANTIDPEERRVAVTLDGRLRDLWIEYPDERAAGKQIFLGRVSKVVPSVNGVFVALGEGRDGFLSLSEFDEPPREGSELVLQVLKPPRKNKGPRLTTRVSFAGKFLVYLPLGEGNGVSRKLGSDDRDLLRQLVDGLPDHRGAVIARTAALGAGAEAVARELQELEAQWDAILQRAQSSRAPVLLWADEGVLGRVLRDDLRVLPEEIYTDNPEDLEPLRRWVARMGGDPSIVVLHRGSSSLFEYHDVERQIGEALKNRVWLPGGGSIVIDQTEALTAVDVNSGKCASDVPVADAMRQVNLEAAAEIAWQIRLRALGGIVVIDFIDMKRPEDRQAVMARLNEALADDPERPHVYPLSPLGLVELSRRRSRPDLRGLLRQGVQYPEGAMAQRLTAQIGAVKRLIRKTVLACHPEALLLALSPACAEAVQRDYQSRWEAEFGCHLRFRPLREFQFGGCRLECTGSLAEVERRGALDWEGGEGLCSLKE